jgi:hypothetical protein
MNRWRTNPVVASRSSRFWQQSSEKAAGLLLVASLLIGLMAVPIMVVSGALPGFAAALQRALTDLAPHAGTFRLLNLLYTLAGIVQLLGFALLARRLAHAGAEAPATLAFTLIAVASILGVLHGTFNMSVMTWAAEVAARTGSAPEGYEVLRVWVSSAFRVGYRAHLLAAAGFGWAIVRTRLLPPPLGWAAIGWSLLWALGSLAGVGAPGLLFIMPAVIGTALLLRG